MPAAAAAILDGMPDARDLHRLDSGGQTMIFAGPVQLFWYAEDDTAARNVAVAVLRQLGFGGEQVAAVMQLTPNYLATLRQRALRDGTPGVSRPAGRARGPPDAAGAVAAGRRRGADPPGGPAAGDRGRVVGAGAGLARGGDAGRRDRPAAAGEPVHGAAPPGPGAPAGGAAAHAGAGRRGAGTRGTPGHRAGGRGAGAGGGGRDGGSGPGGRTAAGDCLVPVRGGDAAARVPRAGRRRDGPGSGR